MDGVQKDLDYKLTLCAPPERVWRALTDPAELRTWLASDVDVDARVGGPFRFWGAAIPGTPGPDDATQAITALERERRLAFTWTWSGVATTVEITLEPKEWSEFEMGTEPPLRAPCPGCELRVQQRFEGTLPFERPEHLADDHWRIVVSNLFGLLQETTVVLPDHGTDAPEVRFEMDVAATPEAVFRALTEPEQLNRWFANAARLEPEVGGGFDLGWGSGDGYAMSILEFEPSLRFALRWPDWRGDARVPDQRVTWTLAPIESGTRVEFAHTGFVRMADRSDFHQGWWGFHEAMARVAQSLA